MTINTLLTGIVVAIALLFALIIVSKILKIGFSILKFKIFLAITAAGAPIITAFLHKAEAIIHFIS